MNRTVTKVHSEASRLAQRAGDLDHQREVMVAVAMTAQALSFGSLYLLPAAANAAWQAALFLLLPFALLRLLALAVSRTAPENAADTAVYRVAAGALALLFLSNMSLCLLAVTELAHVFLFPAASRLTLALAAAMAVGLGIPASPTAVANMARCLRFFLLAAFLFCAATVLPAGEPGYLYPLAGYGLSHTLRCGLMASGSVWMAGALPVVFPGRPAAGLRKALPGIAGLLLVSLFFLCCAYVLPGPELSARWGYALRMLLLMEMSPNTLSWSLMLIAELMLFLTGFSVCADLLRESLRRAFPIRRTPLLPFALACVPLAARGMGQSEAALIALLPWRYPAAALPLMACLAYNLIRKKRRKAA